MNRSTCIEILYPYGAQHLSDRRCLVADGSRSPARWNRAPSRCSSWTLPASPGSAARRHRRRMRRTPSPARSTHTSDRPPTTVSVPVARTDAAPDPPACARSRSGLAHKRERGGGSAQTTRHLSHRRGRLTEGTDSPPWQPNRAPLRDVRRLTSPRCSRRHTGNCALRFTAERWWDSLDLTAARVVVEVLYLMMLAQVGVDSRRPRRVPAQGPQ